MKILGFLYVNLSDFAKRDIVKVGFLIGVKKIRERIIFILFLKWMVDINVFRSDWVSDLVVKEISCVLFFILYMVWYISKICYFLNSFFFGINLEVFNILECI